MRCKMNRPIKELLEFMLENVNLLGTRYESPQYLGFPPFNIDGLCILARYLWVKKIVTVDERDEIRSYIGMHRPNNVSKKYRPIEGEDDYYYWTPNAKPPRVYWLKKHIKLLS